MEDLLNMKKFNAILDETTIINFPFFGKLIARYYILSIIVPISIFIYASFYYINQNIVYIQSTNLTFIIEDSNSPTKAIAKLVGEDTQNLTQSDVVAIGNSPDFIELLSSNLTKRKDFKLLSFDSLKTKKIRFNDQLYKTCNDNQECLTKKVSDSISGFFNLVPSAVIDRMLKLEVKTLTKVTSKSLLQEIRRTLKIFRVQTIKHSVVEQATVTNEIIERKYEEMENLDMAASKQQFIISKHALKNMELRVFEMEKAYQKQEISLNFSKSQVEQTKSMIKNITDKDINLTSKVRIVDKKIKNLRRDIQALELSLEHLSENDKEILQKLKRDLRKKIKQRNKLKKQTKYSSTTKQFLDNKDESSNDFNFNYQVAKKQFDRTVKNLKKLREEKRTLQEKVKKNEVVILRNQPTYEYILLLEKKKLQLALLESTIISDITFDKKSSSVRAFRRTTKGKTFVFSLFISLFSVFVTTIVRYLFDPRIYDEYELQKNFQDLNVIGNTPDFH